MVLDTVITIVNYDRHMFIVQATEQFWCCILAELLLVWCFWYLMSLQEKKLQFISLFCETLMPLLCVPPKGLKFASIMKNFNGTLQLQIFPSFFNFMKELLVNIIFISLGCTYARTFTHPHTHTPIHTHTHTHLSLSHTNTHSHSHTLTHSLSLTHTLSLSLSHTHTRVYIYIREH
jgi:hypothetical protein